MMSKLSKQELTEEIQPRYLIAGKIEKIKILDEFTAATGGSYRLEHPHIHAIGKISVVFESSRSAPFKEHERAIP